MPPSGSWNSVMSVGHVPQTEALDFEGGMGDGRFELPTSTV